MPRPGYGHPITIQRIENPQPAIQSAASVETAMTSQNKQG